MMLAMLCGNLPFSGNSSSEVIEKITKVEYVIPNNIKSNLSYDLKDLIKRIMIADPS